MTKAAARGDETTAFFQEWLFLVQACARTSKTVAGLQAPCPQLRAGCCPADFSPQALWMRLVLTPRRNHGVSGGASGDSVIGSLRKLLWPEMSHTWGGDLAADGPATAGLSLVSPSPGAKVLAGLGHPV